MHAQFIIVLFGISYTKIQGLSNRKLAGGNEAIIGPIEPSRF